MTFERKEAWKRGFSLDKEHIRVQFFGSDLCCAWMYFGTIYFQYYFPLVIIISLFTLLDVTRS